MVFVFHVGYCTYYLVWYEMFGSVGKCFFFLVNMFACVGSVMVVFFGCVRMFHVVAFSYY